ncbi:MAG: electron transfer flavoprotein subunit alpha/FixB family protein [Leptospirales bacterium]|nr:electron transfer flavoprotein subunit alpha/FixB family protein [Leptospirales bacterium]
MKDANILAVLDTIEDKLLQQSLEIITFSEKLSQEKKYKIIALVPGRDAAHICKTVSRYGVDTIALAHNDLYYPNPELMAESIYLLTEKYSPEFIIFTHTMRNVQSAAKLSVKLCASSITAVESFIYDNDSCIIQRSIFNGKIKMNVKLNSSINILTILSGASSMPQENADHRDVPPVINEKITISIDSYKPQSLSKAVETGVRLEEADVIIAAGRGIVGEENLNLIKETAALFKNSAIGASRPICDNRWLPYSHQVGITGRVVSPRFYMACGISGSQQHIAGMKNSQIVAAINKDTNAAIFSIADYIIVDDLLLFLPVFIKKSEESDWRLEVSD